MIAPCTRRNHRLATFYDCGAVESPPACHCLATALSPAHPHRIPCQQTRSALVVEITMHPLLPDHWIVPARDESRVDCPTHPPAHESWCSARLCCVRSLAGRFFTRSGTVLMRTHNGAIDHRVLIVGIDTERLKYLRPHAALSPTTMPSMGILPIPKPCRQVTPGNPRTVTVQHRFDKSPIIRGRTAYLPASTWQQRTDP